MNGTIMTLRHTASTTDAFFSSAFSLSLEVCNSNVDQFNYYIAKDVPLGAIVSCYGKHRAHGSRAGNILMDLLESIGLDIDDCRLMTRRQL